MSTIISSTSVYTNRTFPFDKIELSQLEKRNRKYYIDFTIEDTPIFLQINKVKLISEPIFIDEEQGYIDIEVQDRINEISTYFNELDNYNQLICYKHCEEWLGKSLEMAQIENVYKKSYKDRVIRLKIEKETIKMYDMKKNKLNIDNDLKQGDTLDVIMEIGGLKLMKSAFSTHIILRQIRKHPEEAAKKKMIPNEYLFLDEYSNRPKAVIRDDSSLDDQTDVDHLIPKKITKPSSIKPKVPITELMGSSRKSSESKPMIEDDSVDLSELKDPISSEEDTKEYLKNVHQAMENQIEDSSMNKSKISEDPSRKDLILEALENGEIGLESIISSVSKSIKIPKSKLNTKQTSKKATTKYTDDELHKNI